jgi:hypothetical protein
MQAIAIILPRVQRHFACEFCSPVDVHACLDNLPSTCPQCFPSRPVPDNQIGLLSSAMFAGMMFGAVGWGTCTLTCLHELDKPKAFLPQALISWVAALRSTRRCFLHLSSA